MKSTTDLVADARLRVRQVMPWDLAEMLAKERPPLLLDVREPAEFAAMHIRGSLNVPRGTLEMACDWDFDDTVPALASNREAEIIVICRSGSRSALAAEVMQQLGYSKVASLKTGVRGWNESEQPLVNAAGERVDPDAAEEALAPHVRPDQRKPR
jgi:rhodanese-related sulfurtransferase